MTCALAMIQGDEWSQFIQFVDANWRGIAGALILITISVLYTFWPENVFASQREKTRLDYLLERKEQLYENLRDLNFEHRAGKYPEEDFVVQRAQLENEAVQLLAEIEHLQQA